MALQPRFGPAFGASLHGGPVVSGQLIIGDQLDTRFEYVIAGRQTGDVCTVPAEHAGK